MITSVVEGKVASSSGAGSHSVGNPESFRNSNDSNLYSDISATMVSGASQTSEAMNRLDFEGAFRSSPTATRTSAKIRVRAWPVATLNSGAGASAYVKVGVRYSFAGVVAPGLMLNLFEIEVTTPGTSQGPGGFTDYEVTIPLLQNINNIVIEAYTEAFSGAGGASGAGSVARIFAQAGFVEDFEESVDLVLVRPNAVDDDYIEVDPQNALFRLLENLGQGHDGNINSYNHLTVEREAGHTGSTSSGQLDVTYSFPTLQTPGAVHAQAVVHWAAEIGMNTMGDMPTGSSGIQIQRNAGEGFTAYVGAASFLSRSTPGTSLTPGSDLVTPVYQSFVQPITDEYIAVEQVKIRSQSIISQPGTILTTALARVQTFIFEVWLEVRVNSGLVAGMSGWEPV